LIGEEATNVDGVTSCGTIKGIQVIGVPFRHDCTAKYREPFDDIYVILFRSEN
jgi:hypothetical protein